MIALVIDAKVMIETFEPLFELWLDLCRAITPDSWETLGNILLGLAWMGSGILFYSASFGAVVTYLLYLMERRKGKNTGDRTAPPSESWWPFALWTIGVALVALFFFILIAADPPAPKDRPDKGMPRQEDISAGMGKGVSDSPPEQ